MLYILFTLLTPYLLSVLIILAEHVREIIIGAVWAFTFSHLYDVWRN